MPCAQHYTYPEVNRILQESEGRSVRPGGPGGHALGLHVEVAGNDISDRLLRMGRPVGAPTRRRTGRDADGNRPLTGSLEHHSLTAREPILLGPRGTAELPDYVATWNNTPTGGTLSRSQRRPYENRFRQAFVTETGSSGAFVDRQQAIRIAHFLLNSTEGMAQLDLLDNGSEQRVVIRIPVPQVLGRNAVMVNHATSAPGGSDITNQRPIVEAVMVVDVLAPGEIHIQTFYPVV